MQDQIISQEVAEATRKAKWNEFLDAYSTYLGLPSLQNAATLKLAGSELEETDATFSMESFADRIGWREEVECPN